MNGRGRAPASRYRSSVGIFAWVWQIFLRILWSTMLNMSRSLGLSPCQISLLKSTPFTNMTCGECPTLQVHKQTGHNLVKRIWRWSPRQPNIKLHCEIRLLELYLRYTQPNKNLSTIHQNLLKLGLKVSPMSKKPALFACFDNMNIKLWKRIVGCRKFFVGCRMTQKIKF